MGSSIEFNFSILTIFGQGLLSFFSPCVLPLVPLYISYLAGGAKSIDEKGKTVYKRSKVMLNTTFFVLGISFAFFSLGLSASALSRFFVGNRLLFARVSGILIILLGLYQIGFLDFKFLAKDRRLPFKLDKIAMNPLVALVLGFTFSFAWTPCVGPALAMVLLKVSTAKNFGLGFLLIGVYTLGFVLPFLGVGLFTSQLLNWFKKHQNIVKYTAKIGGALLILMGIMTFTGWMDSVTGWLSSFGGAAGGGTVASSSAVSQSSIIVESGTGASEEVASAKPPLAASSSVPEKIPAIDFTLTDQFGEVHTLSDYKGKVIFLNFWGTWCPPCRSEMPDIQALYEENGLNAEDLVVLGVANPKSEINLQTNEGTKEEITAFLEENKYTYPTVMDITGEFFYNYGIQFFPTTFMIDRDGNVYGYVSGAITRSIMDAIVQETIDLETQN